VEMIDATEERVSELANIEPETPAELDFVQSERR
jgi:hypothetical protein